MKSVVLPFGDGSVPNRAQIVKSKSAERALHTYD
jgi:hypothetical protein